MYKKRIDLVSTRPSDGKIGNKTLIAFAETEDGGNTVDLALGFETGIEFKRFVDVDNMGTDGIGEFSKPVVDERFNLFTWPAPFGAELEDDVPGVLCKQFLE